MNKKSSILGIVFGLLITLSISLLLYLQTFESLSEEDRTLKREYVKLTTLADLSLANEALYVRHRSLASTFSIYSNDANLLEDKLPTFTISDAKIKK